MIARRAMVGFFYCRKVPSARTGRGWNAAELGRNAGNSKHFHFIGVGMTADFTELDLQPQLVQAVVERGYSQP